MRQARRHVTQTGKQVQSKDSAGLRSHKLSDITRIRTSIAGVWATLHQRPRRHKRKGVTSSSPCSLLPSFPFFNTLLCDYTDSGEIVGTLCGPGVLLLPGLGVLRERAYMRVPAATGLTARQH